MTVFYNEARKRWQYDFRAKGKRYAGYADHPKTGDHATSRRQAEQHEALIREAVRQTINQPQASPTSAGITLAEAMAYYAQHVGQHRNTWSDIRVHIRELLDRFGATIPVDTISQAQVRDYIAWSREQEAQRYVGGPASGGSFVNKGTKRKASTINKYLNTLRAVFNLCLRDEKISRAPSVAREKEPEDLPNPIREADLELILSAAPPHLRAVIVLCTMTGMRHDECLSLRWDQVDLDRGIITLYSAGTKAGRGRAVYLNHTAKEVLANLSTDRVSGCNHVIMYRHRGKGEPRPIKDIHKAWYLTLERAGLKGKYRFHDTRAAFCSLLAARGIDAVHIRTLAGHADIGTTMRYVKASDERLRAAVQMLDDKSSKRFSQTADADKS